MEKKCCIFRLLQFRGKSFFKKCKVSIHSSSVITYKIRFKHEMIWFSFNYRVKCGSNILMPHEKYGDLSFKNTPIYHTQTLEGIKGKPLYFLAVLYYLYLLSCDLKAMLFFLVFLKYLTLK